MGCAVHLSTESQSAKLLGPEGEGEHPHAGIARHQGQHVPSSRRSGDQPNHAGPIEAGHAVRAETLLAEPVG
jgi:hypothetical protein